MTRLHRSDRVPIWSTQMCGRLSLEPAHVILSFCFLLRAKVLEELEKYWGESKQKKKKYLFLIILCQTNIQEFGDGSNQKFYH